MMQFVTKLIMKNYIHVVFCGTPILMMALVFHCIIATPIIIKMMMMFTILQMMMMMMISALALVFHGTPTPSVNVTRGMPGWSTHLDHH